MQCTSHWELLHPVCHAGSHCTAPLLLGAGASEVSCWEMVRYVCSDASQHSTHALVRLHVSYFSLPLWDLLCFACILLVAGTLHTSSALLGVVVLLVFCWELVHQVCPQGESWHCTYPAGNWSVPCVQMGAGTSYGAHPHCQPVHHKCPAGGQLVTGTLLAVRASAGSCCIAP